ncbi:MAG: lysostaphin resistance A-like protein, partial [Planctomycetia bacterium]
IVLPGQLVFVLIACVLGFLSREAFLDRLALRKPQVGLLPIALVLVGMVGVQLGMSALTNTFGLTSEYLDFLRKLLVDAGRAPAASLVILLALVPAFCQELFFRGLVQSRLVAVWPAGAAVLLTATVWSLVHVDTSRVLAALPIGLYLGIVAWKSASTWVAILAAAVNYLTMLFLAPHMNAAGAGGFVLICVLLGAGMMGIFALIRTGRAQVAANRVLETLK